MAAKKGGDGPTIIKKYANRRLYDTSASAYVTLDHLSRLVREGREFVVQDAKTGEDLTRSVLTQIIFEQENRQEGVLPLSFLRQIIQFYGESVQSILPAYLEMSMNSFAKQQEQWREHIDKTVGDTAEVSPFEAQIRRNMAMFEETMRMFTPMGAGLHPAQPTEPSPAKPEDAPKSDTPANDTQADALANLQKQMADMQKQLATLAHSSDKDAT